MGYSPWGHKELDTTEQLSTSIYPSIKSYQSIHHLSIHHLPTYLPSIYLSIIYLLLLSHFICVRLCATPEKAVHQAPPSLGFFRQQHWSGLPLPSPMHESEK